jgi:hypothetical protein
MRIRVLCLGFALLCPLLVTTAWPRVLPQPLPLEQGQPAFQQPRAAASKQAAQLLEDLKATASSTLDGQYFGAHHLFDGDPHTCWIGGAGAASWTLTITLSDIYRLDMLELDAYAGHGVAELDIAYALDGQRYTLLHEGLSPAGAMRLGGVLATHLRLTLREPLIEVPVIAELRVFGR